MDTPADPRIQPHIITILTTEHYNLQTGRASTISDSNGRASLFVGTVSTSLVALAFIGQSSKLGNTFYVFALLVIPVLLFLGIVTFQRVVQTAIQDVIYARGINRIRHFYQEIAPEMKPYFILSPFDDDRSAYEDMGTSESWWVVFLTTAGMIAVITAMLAGIFVGLLLTRVTDDRLLISIPTGIFAGLLCLILLLRSQWKMWGRAQRHIVSLFPRQPEQEDIAQMHRRDDNALQKD